MAIKFPLDEGDIYYDKYNKKLYYLIEKPVVDESTICILTDVDKGTHRRSSVWMPTLHVPNIRYIDNDKSIINFIKIMNYSVPSHMVISMVDGLVNKYKSELF